MPFIQRSTWCIISAWLEALPNAEERPSGLLPFFNHKLIPKGRDAAFSEALTMICYVITLLNLGCAHGSGSKNQYGLPKPNFGKTYHKSMTVSCTTANPFPKCQKNHLRIVNQSTYCLVSQTPTYYYYYDYY